MAENSLIQEAFKLKGRLFTLTVLELFPCKLEQFEAQIEAIYHKAPNMFANTPIVLDLKPLAGCSFDLKGVANIMRAFQMVPVGVQHASVIQQKAAAAAGLAVLLSRDGDEAKPLKKAIDAADNGAVVSNSIKHRSQSVTSNVKVEPSQSQPKQAAATTDAKPVAIESSARQSKVITQPVRSGQQVYAKDADLIVLSSVGTGAELLADGHIHVYGTLRGRALAGINGDKSARIFCSKLQAELVSVAGQYLMPQEKCETYQGSKQILIEGEHLKIIDL